MQAWGVAEARCGEHSRARTIFQRAVAKFPESVSCWQAWGKMELSAGADPGKGCPRRSSRFWKMRTGRWRTRRQEKAVDGGREGCVELKEGGVEGVGVAQKVVE